MDVILTESYDMLQKGTIIHDVLGSKGFWTGLYTYKGESRLTSVPKRYCKEYIKKESKIGPHLHLKTRLYALSKEMIEIGTAMDYLGGFGKIGEHGRELIGAGKIAKEWAEADWS